MDGLDIKFGVEIPTFTGGGGAHRDCPLYDKVEWRTIKRTAIEAESLGYDNILMADHLGYITPDSTIFEIWSTLSALASVTKKVGLQSLVICNSYRNPALVAKMGATLDVISDGRLILGYGAGWNEKEYSAYGILFPKALVRIRQMREGVKIIKKMWTEDNATYEGKYYTIKDMVCRPKPVQKPHPPIIIGATQPLMLRAAVEVGDGLNVPDDPSVKQYREKLAIVEKRCDELGKDYDNFVKTWDGHVIVRKTEKEAKEFVKYLQELQAKAIAEYQTLREASFDWWTGLMIPGDSLERYFIGTPDQVAEKIQRFLDIGVSQFGLWFPEYPSFEGIRLFAEEVIPKFK